MIRYKNGPSVQNMVTLLSFFCITFLVEPTQPAFGHFLWIYKDGGDFKVVFGEGRTPDQARFLEGLDTMQVYQVTNGQPQLLEREIHEKDSKGWFQLNDVQGGADGIDAHCQYGVFGGSETKMLLDYGAKYLAIDRDSQVKSSGKLRFDLMPRWVQGKLQVQTLFDGQPVEGAEVIAFVEESQTTEGLTNHDGRILLSPKTRWIVRAKHVIKKAGTHEGQPYQEQRYYCTLVIDSATTSTGGSVNSTLESSQAVTSVTATPEKYSSTLPPLPVGITSFGATSLDGKFYVLGGQKGRAHSYADSYQNSQLWSLDTTAHNANWQTIGEYRGLQGLALIGYEGGLYAIGGLEARNREGQEHDLHSIADFRRFDLKSRQWSALPSLPVGLSSFDACVLDHTLYVMGGWTMRGQEPSLWSKKVFSYDLASDDSQWQSVDGPIEVRALSVAAYRDRIYAIGGINSDGDPVDEVAIFNPATGKWSEGPSLPTIGNMGGFGNANVVVNDRLIVSTYDGGVFVFGKDDNQWSELPSLDQGRFFHRLLPLSNSAIALIGGANMTAGKFTETTVVDIAAAKPTKP